MKSDGVARQVKRRYNVENLVHPAQSPDLNPIEGVWNILKQRVRQRSWTTVEELKAVLRDEWSKITLDDIRKRIDEWPERCARLVKNNGAPIRSDLW